jgi:maltooligosyltrehalose trehalohydrolase
MTSRKHLMPFGAAVTPNGVRFRLWAPGAERVDLRLAEAGGERDWPMEPLGNGWFERIAAEAGPGSRYRFRLDGGLCVPDPASRCNPDDVHGASRVVDPEGYAWPDADWRGRPWEEAVIYEFHVGAFTPEGTFRAAIDRLDYLADLGVTALEIMPVADFPGHRNWGYDGVLPFAPDAAYGTPEDFKALIAAAHGRGLMVFLDVVYNHFGPDGNYLYAYARPFFSERHHTPWGAALDFDGAGNRPVREFFIHNALFWLEEYHLDGLRLDAVHAIRDDSETSILTELAERVRSGPGRERPVHLILENDANQARYLPRTGKGDPVWYTAQWNDDLHHVLHLLLTGETDGYYADYVDEPLRWLGRALAEGFAYQGERSPYREGRPRGETSRHLPPTAFVSFLQTHDQVGNRAYGERLAQLAEPRSLRAALTLLLLAPSPPLLFMGEEFACPAPFRYFCEFGPDLAEAVTRGRREEFARFERYAAPEARAAIPDPNDPATFRASKLAWEALEQPAHAEWLGFYRHLLRLRRARIVPRIPLVEPGRARFELIVPTVSVGMHPAPLRGARRDAERPRRHSHAERGNDMNQDFKPLGLRVEWPLRDGGMLAVLTNPSPWPLSGLDPPPGCVIGASDGDAVLAVARGDLPAESTVWFVKEGEGHG